EAYCRAVPRWLPRLAARVARAGVWLALLLAPAAASANPTINPRIDELGSLPRAIIAGSQTKDETRFAQLVGQLGLAWIKPDTFALVDRNFDRFERALVWSQRPGWGLDPAVQGLLRARLRGALRDTVIAELRGWLRLEVPREKGKDKDHFRDPAEALV